MHLASIRIAFAYIALFLGVTTASSAEFGISGMNVGMPPAQVEKAALAINPDWKWSGFTEWDLPSGEKFVKFGKWGHPNPETRFREDIDVMFTGPGSGNGLVAINRTILFGNDVSKVPLGKAVADGLLAKFGKPSQILEDQGSYRIIWKYDESGKLLVFSDEFRGECTMAADLVGTNMVADCGLFIMAEIASDDVGLAGRLNFQLIDHHRAVEAVALDEAYAQKSLEDARAKAATTTAEAPKF